MRHDTFSPLGKCLLVVPMALVMFGCASNIRHDYAINNEKNDPIIEVVRDNKTAIKSKSDSANDCKTNFYINNAKVGAFAIADLSNYQLAPGQYNFSVDNCQGRCSRYGLDVEIKQGEFQKFILSADATGKPFIIVNQSK